MDIQNDAPGGIAADEEMDLRAQLEAATKEVSERDAAPPAAASDTPPQADTDADKPGQARGPDGKFTTAETKPAATDPNAPPVTTDPAAVLGEAPKVPASVPAALRDKFNAMDPELQAWINSREADVHKQFTRNDEERNFGRQLKDVITPYMPIIQAEGGTPAAAVQDLLNTAYVLRTGSPEQKVELLRTVAKQFNIDLTQASAPPAFVDPAMETLQQRIDRLERERQAETQRTETQARQQVQDEIAAFASDPANGHFEQVKATMAVLLQSGTAKDLKDAYEQACWANPTIRSTLEAQRAGEAERKRLEAANAAAEAAKRAAGSVTGSPGAIPPANADPNRSLEDELRANLRLATGRV